MFFLKPQILEFDDYVKNLLYFFFFFLKVKFLALTVTEKNLKI